MEVGYGKGRGRGKGKGARAGWGYVGRDEGGDKMRGREGWE